jgi:hypothetical protein
LEILKKNPHLTPCPYIETKRVSLKDSFVSSWDIEDEEQIYTQIEKYSPIKPRVQTE